MTASGTSHRSPRLADGDAFESPTLPAPAVPEPPATPKTYGHYAIEHRPDGSPWLLGRGGMGMTFKALDTNLRCPVALKIIGPQCFGGERSERRFIREAQLAAQIRHPNVAAIHHLDCQNGEFFYAMEYVDGISADAWVRQRGPMSVDLALDIVMQITRALTAADRLKVLHRDVKPGNIMILPDPANGNRVIAKLIDFGLARSVAGEASPTATTCGGFTGTPQFASPEQAENLELDVRSDIYSLGSTLWYFVVGEAPFVGTPARIIAQLLTAEPPWERVKKLPREVKGLLHTMLAKDPGGRPQTPVALHNHIMACREKLAQRPARSTSASGKKAGAFSSYLNTRSLALAGGLALILLLLAFSPHGRDDSRNSPRPEAMRNTDLVFTPPPPLPAPAMATAAAASAQQASAAAPAAPPPEAGPNETGADLAPVAVRLTDFDLPEETFSLAPEIADPATAIDLQQASSVAFSIAGLKSPVQEVPPPTSVAKAVVKSSGTRNGGNDRRHGGRSQRRVSTWQSLDRVRGSVEGLIRHFF